MVNNWSELFSRNIRFEREKLGFTQLDLAQRVGLDSSTTVAIWENGKGLPRMTIFHQLCVLFEKSPNELMYMDLSAPHPPLSTTPNGGGGLRAAAMLAPAPPGIDVGVGAGNGSPPTPLSIAESPPGETKLDEIEDKLLDALQELHRIRKEKAVKEVTV